MTLRVVGVFVFCTFVLCVFVFWTDLWCACEGCCVGGALVFVLGVLGCERDECFLR